MYKQIIALFTRYIAAHLVARGQPKPITDSAGSLIGAIDIFLVSDGQIRFAGWVRADEVVLHMNGAKASTRASLTRQDVTDAHGISANVGFDMVVPVGPLSMTEMNRFGVEFHGTPTPERRIAVSLPLVRIWWVRLSLLASFVCALMWHLPACIAWVATGNPKFRMSVKRALKLASIPVPNALDPDLFRATACRKPETAITIILPVFNAFTLLQDTLDRVLRHTDLPWSIIIIEDCSTDPKIRPMLQAWKSQHGDRVTLIEHARNLGFIASVNEGIQLALKRTGIVVLLNSDALVPPDWSSRLIRPMRVRKNVASVTPFSNNAEILTVPLMCMPATVNAGEADLIDQTAATLNPDVGYQPVPTGVGFCMALNPKFLRKLPELDVVFGRGYGEEVDWCQRARALGGIHLCATNLFVEHRGGQSFGSVEKQRLIAQNSKTISKRYPKFDSEVQAFVRSDPLQSHRIAIALAWVGAQDFYPVPIYLAHSLGGGAEAYLKNRISRKHHALGRSAVILRVGGPTRWQIELSTPDGVVAVRTESTDHLLKLLSPLKSRRIIYSCGVGDSDPISLPSVLLGLSNNGEHQTEILLHDYFALSPNYTLVGENGVYESVPDGAPPSTDLDHKPTAFTRWQREWNKLISAATEITAFSESSARIVTSVYPSAEAKIQVKPHNLLRPIPKIPHPATDARRVVAILGDIAPQKGARLISEVAPSLEAAGIELVVIGNFDPEFTLPASVRIHGTYKLEQLAQIATRYGVTDWLIPSIWPETFSYTTHEALATGLPVHAYALGAQGEAVAKAENGRPIPYLTDTSPAINLLKHLTFHLITPKRVA